MPTTYLVPTIVKSTGYFGSKITRVFFLVHSMALGYSAMIIIMERNEGLLDRTWVAGMYYEKMNK